MTYRHRSSEPCPETTDVAASREPVTPRSANEVYRVCENALTLDVQVNHELLFGIE
jgi:hypothetical protein